MAASANAAVMSVEEYLESERHSAIKHEYVDGHVYAMAGGTRAHGVIAVNVTIALGNHLRGGPCRVYNSDVKVQLTETRYVYPDASVGCDERDRLDDDEDVVRYPPVVVEVLSSSTEAYDRGAKFALYRSSETLREYVLVSTDVWPWSATAEARTASGRYTLLALATRSFWKASVSRVHLLRFMRASTCPRGMSTCDAARSSLHVSL